MVFRSRTRLFQVLQWNGFGNIGEFRKPLNISIGTRDHCTCWKRGSEPCSWILRSWQRPCVRLSNRIVWNFSRGKNLNSKTNSLLRYSPTLPCPWNSGVLDQLLRCNTWTCFTLGISVPSLSQNQHIASMALHLAQNYSSVCRLERHYIGEWG